MNIYITQEVFLYKDDNYRRVSRATHSGANIDNYLPDLKSDEEIKEELMSQENFYKVKEIFPDDIVPGEWVTVDLKDKLGDSLRNQEELPIDTFSHHKITPKLQYTYNSQLHIANYKRTLSRGWPLRSFKKYRCGRTILNTPDVKTADEAVRSLEYVAVDIKTDQGSTKVVRSGGAKYAQSFEMYNLMPVLSYPDRRATKMTLFRQYEGTPSVTERVFLLVKHPLLPSEIGRS